MTRKELEQIRCERLKEISPILLGKNNGKTFVLVCSSTGCESGGSGDLFLEFKQIVEKNEKEEKIEIRKTGCFGLCGEGPIVVVYPKGVFYTHVKKADVQEIFDKHLMGGEVVERLLATDATGKKIETIMENRFYEKQTFIARHQTGKIDPESIEDYVAANGYFAILDILENKKPEDVVCEIKKSGLRGRGGAGFLTGLKWEIGAKNAAKKKFVVCNGDEGDPGAFMDRSIFEGNPHKIVEGLMIAGFATFAHFGVVYIREEYPLAGKRILKAIADAKKMGMLGKNIFGSGFDFDISVKFGAGAFVCGEETALIKSCMGRRGEPVIKPPFPAEKGLYGFPTIINNVETLALVPEIMLNSAEWFLKKGTKTSSGTKVFAVTGKVKTAGLVELSMGTTLREIVFDVCGGIPGGKKFKAVQIGGPSGGCLPEELLDLKIDFEELKSHGAMMGSGGMIVLDEDCCMVDIAKFFLEFSMDESCGKCTPCRIGNKRLLELLIKITDGKGEMSDIKELEDLSNYVKENSLCALGGTSPNPVLSTLKYFKNEYIAHIVDKRCPAGVCEKLTNFSIDKSKCVGCGACFRACPNNAIGKNASGKYEIDLSKCIKCGKCKESCRFNAVLKG